MKTYLLHGLNNKIIDKFISKFEPNSVLTFDDGLRSVYKYYPNLKKYLIEKNLKMIILINPKIVLMSTAQSYLKDNNIYDFIECFNAHKILKLKRNACFFMDLEDLYDFREKTDVEIGLHGWDHFLWSKIDPKSIKKFKEDIENQLDFYLTHKDLFPEKYLSFAWPYNKEYSFYKNYFQKLFKEKTNIKFIRFFGSERISGSWNYYENFDKKNKKGDL